MKIVLPAGMAKVRWNGRKHMRCLTCAKYPHIVKQYNPYKPLSIASERGTRALSDVVNDHLKSKCHTSCVEADRVSSMGIEKRPSTSMDVSIRNANRKNVSRVGKLMLQVYLDAKLLNLPAHSWPARYVGGEASSAYDAEVQTRSTIADNINLQYVNPHGHLELMTSIVNSNQHDFIKKIDDAWAISLRVDGSVDFTQIDKIYVMAKVINFNGSAELLFIGVGKQTQRKAIGLKNHSSSVTFTVRARAIFAAAILFLVLFCCFRCGIVYQILFTAYVQRKRMNILWFDFGDEFVGLSS